MNVSWILHRDFLEGNKKGHRFTLAVALYILTLRLTIPIPLKYPTRVWFLGGGGVKGQLVYLLTLLLTN